MFLFYGHNVLSYFSEINEDLFLEDSSLHMVFFFFPSSYFYIFVRGFPEITVIFTQLF